MGEMADWPALARELDRWADAGLVAECWWRDDDAQSRDPRLQQLLDLRAAFSLPLALAIPPMQADADLWRYLSGVAGVTALVHGAAHRNHAPQGEKKAEFGPHRPLPLMQRELSGACAALNAAAAAAAVAALPVLVPPWNRIDPRLLPALPGLGYVGLSTFGAGEARQPGAGLTVCNCHLDIIDWRGTRGLVPASRLLATLTGLLATRRSRLQADPGASGDVEPIGILTHHQVQGADSNDFLRRLFDALCQPRNGRPAVRWLSARQIFAPDRDAIGELSSPPRNG